MDRMPTWPTSGKIGQSTKGHNSPENFLERTQFKKNENGSSIRLPTWPMGKVHHSTKRNNFSDHICCKSSNNWDRSCKICQENKEKLSLQILKQEKEYDTWYHIPVKVNVIEPLPKAPETEEELETKIGTMIKLANAYLAKAGIALKYDANVDLNFGMGGISALDGNLDVDNPITGMRAKTEIDALYYGCCDPSNEDAELKIGRKIVIATELGNKYGYTVHPSTSENGHLSKMLIIENMDEDTMGYVLAHEFCHSVTLGPDHKYTGGNDPWWGHADKEGHVEPGDGYHYGFDENNVEHRCNLMREYVHWCLEGSGRLTEEQREEIRDYIADKEKKGHNVGEEKRGDDRRVKNNYKRTASEEKNEYKKDNEHFKNEHKKDRKDFKNEYKKDNEHFKNEHKKDRKDFKNEYKKDHHKGNHHTSSEDRRHLYESPYDRF